MRLSAITFLIVSSLVLCACASREEIAARHAAAEQTAELERANRCGSFGYKVGTPDYSHCLERMYVQDQQAAATEEANRQARIQAAAEGLQRAGAALQNISPPPPPPPQPMFNQPVHCNTMPMGAGTSTTCF